MAKKLAYIVLLIALLFVNCTRELAIKPVGEKNMLVVLGEVRTSDSIVVHLSTAKNVSLPGSSQEPVNHAKIQIFDAQHNLKAELRKSGINKWSSPFIPSAGGKYTFKIETDERKAQLSVVLPKDFSARIIKQTSYNDVLMEVTLQMENVGRIRSNYVVEYLQVKNNGLQLQYIECPDTKTDNNIYNELTSPFKRIFLKADNSTATLTMRVAKPNLSEKYIMRIKSVDNAYYRYLYSYEVQKDNVYAFMDFISDPNYVGILGGVNKKDIEAVYP
ncbi:MAG: DUF4249 family protein [Bacteroidia bacterium]|nr:DUF4249 family protein [Bacteroidia bacterium]